MRPQVIRRDERYLRDCRRAFAAIGLAMPPTLLAMMLASRVSGESMAVPMLLWMAGSAALGWYAFVRPLGEYRCPQCDRVLPRAEEARPAIRFRCEPCGVDWDVERTTG